MVLMNVTLRKVRGKVYLSGIMQRPGSPPGFRNGAPGGRGSMGAGPDRHICTNINE